MIERRRAAPDDGPDAGRRAQLAAELAAERGDARARPSATRLSARRGSSGFATAIARDEKLAPVLRRCSRRSTAPPRRSPRSAPGSRPRWPPTGEAGEHVAAELRACAQQEAVLQARLHRENEALTEPRCGCSERVTRSRTQSRSCGSSRARLELEAEPAAERSARRSATRSRPGSSGCCGAASSSVRSTRWPSRSTREALEHVEELERQRADLETALRELQKLIADTDRQIRETFEETFARGGAQLRGALRPAVPRVVAGRLRLVTERDGPARVLGGPGAPDADGRPARTRNERRR